MGGVCGETKLKQKINKENKTGPVEIMLKTGLHIELLQLSLNYFVIFIQPIIHFHTSEDSSNNQVKQSAIP